MAKKPGLQAKMVAGLQRAKKAPTIKKVAPPQPGSKWRKKADGRVFVLMGYGLLDVNDTLTNHAIYRDEPGGTIWLMEVGRFFKEFDLFKAAPARKNVTAPVPHNDPKARTFTNKQLADLGEAGRLKKKKRLN